MMLFRLAPDSSSNANSSTLVLPELLFAVGYGSSLNRRLFLLSLALATILDLSTLDISPDANSSTLVLPELKFLITLISVCPVVSAVYVDCASWF